MSLESHILELTEKHKTLDAKIRKELAHPSSDDLRVAELKRKKLMIKDELIKLDAQPN